MTVQHEISPKNLEELQKLFVAVLQGSRLDPFGKHGTPDSLGPLMHVVARRGNWRPDWLAVARGVFQAALTTFEAAPGRFNSPHTAESALSSLRGDFGLDAYPSKHNADKSTGRGTRSSWKERLYTSEAVLNSLSRNLDTLADLGPGPCDGSCEQEPPLSSRSVLPLIFPTLWFEPADDHALLQRARTVLSCHMAERDDSEDMLSSLIRGAVAARLAEYFDGTEHDAVNYYRYLHHAVLPAWARQIIHGPPPDVGGGDEPVGGNYKRVLAAATQMFAWVVTSDLDDRKTLRNEYEQLYVAGTTSSLWQLLQDEQPLLAGPLVLGLVDFNGISHLERSGGLRSMLATAPASPLTVEGIEPRTGDEFMRLAWEVRRCTEPELKVRYLTAYVSARERISTSRSEAHLFNGADHLASWDTVTAEFPVLAARLARAMEHNPTPGVSGYRTLRYRSQAILANKQNKASLADYVLNLGIAELASFVDLPEIERVESSQQMLLAKAGLRVRQTEMYLREVPRHVRVKQAGWASHRALASAGAAHRLLLDLAPGLPLDPLTARSQGRTASASWNIQTRMVRLRCALAARTVIAAGLAGEDLLEGLDDAERRIVSDTGELFLAWRELVGRDELAEVHQLDLCRVGLWLAFLTGMEVPLTTTVARAASRLSFFNASPADIEVGKQECSVDPQSASWWLTKNHQADAGWLSWAKRSSAAADSLERLSGGAYLQWHTQEKLRCNDQAIVRSHD